MLFPEEEAARSKTHEFDTSIPLDLGRHKWLSRLLILYKGHCDRSPFGKVICVDYNVFRKNLADACEFLGISHLGITPHSFRHSGPSHDRAQGHRDLFGVRQRGRWRADRSVQRYDKHGRLGYEWSKLDQSSRDLCTSLAGRAVHDFTMHFNSLCSPPSTR